MAWQTPKTNWGQPGQTVPAATDFNRIEGNTQYLKDEIDLLVAAQDSGSWTPILINGDNVQQPVLASSGVWHKIGNMVTIQARIIVGSGVSGNLRIIGIPSQINISSGKPAYALNAVVSKGGNENGHLAMPSRILASAGIVHGAIYLYQNNAYLLGSSLEERDSITVSGTYVIA